MTRVTARPGLFTRLVLTEPARLFTWILAIALICAGLAAGYFTEDYAQWLIGAVGAAIAAAGAGEATRASVYSQAGHLQGMIAARGSWAVQSAVDQGL